MGFFGKIARSAGRGVVLGSSAALRGGGRILAVHVLPDELVPSWKTKKRLSIAGSLLSSGFSKSGKKKGKTAKQGKAKPSARPAPSSAFGGNHRNPSAPAGADRTQLPRMLSFRGLPGFNMLPQLREKKRAAVAARSFLDVNGNVLAVDPNFFDKNGWGRGDKLVSNQDWFTDSRSAVESAASRLVRSRGGVERRRAASRPAAPSLALFAPGAGTREELNSYPFTPSRVSRAAGRKKSFKGRREAYS